MKVLRAMLPFSFILHLILIIDEALFYIYTVPIVMTSKWWKWDLQKALLFHRPENVCLTKVKETDPKRTSEWGAKRRIGIRSLEQGSNSN